MIEWFKWFGYEHSNIGFLSEIKGFKVKFNCIEVLKFYGATVSPAENFGVIPVMVTQEEK